MIFLSARVEHELAARACAERARTLFVSRSAFHVKSGEYFAPTGHTGEHVSLRQHCARPPYATEFFADG